MLWASDPRDDGPLLAAVETGWGALRSVPGVGHVRQRLELRRLAAERIAGPCCTSLSRKVVDDRTGCQRQVGEPAIPEPRLRRDQDLSLVRSDPGFRQPPQRHLPKHLRQESRRVVPVPPTSTLQPPRTPC